MGTSKTDGFTEQMDAEQEKRTICFSEAIRSGLYRVCVEDALDVPAEFRSGEDPERSPNCVDGGRRRSWSATRHLVR